MTFEPGHRISSPATSRDQRNQSPKIQAPPIHGALVIDKPTGWTSHDVVGKARRLLDTRRVGHLGTLDPLATGVLPLLVGQATRLAKFFDQSTKAYDATIRFGFPTNTYDRDGEASSERP